MTNFIVIKLMEKSNNLQKNSLLQSFLMNYPVMATDQFGFIVLSKVIENVDIAIIFPLCFQLLNDERVYGKVKGNPNCSLLVQNVFDTEYLNFIEFHNPDYDIGTSPLVLYLSTEILEVSHTFTGSKVISKSLEKIKLTKIDGLLAAILTHFKELSTNEFGNYIIQTII